LRKPAGLRLLSWSQRRAEKAHSRARHALLQQDQRLGTMLAFTGGLE
jgi:preprotein translocase subunit SecA